MEVLMIIDGAAHYSSALTVDCTIPRKDEVVVYNGKKYTVFMQPVYNVDIGEVHVHLKKLV